MLIKSKILKTLICSSLVIPTAAVVTTACSTSYKELINGLTTKQNTVISAAAYVGFASYYGLRATTEPSSLDNAMKTLYRILGLIDGIIRTGYYMPESYVLTDEGNGYFLQKVWNFSSFVGVIDNDYPSNKDSRGWIDIKVDLDYKPTTEITQVDNIITYKSTLNGTAKPLNLGEYVYNYKAELLRKEDTTKDDYDIDDTASFTFAKQGTTDVGFKIVQTHCDSEGWEKNKEKFTYYDLSDSQKPIFSLIFELYNKTSYEHKMVYEYGNEKYFAYYNSSPSPSIEAVPYDDISKTIARWEWTWDNPCHYKQTIPTT